MTTLVLAQINNQDKVEDCLKKIELSSKHLLSLINDILDMSKIESFKITLNRTKISLKEMVSRVSAIIQPRAQDTGNYLKFRAEGISHPYFYGDTLRVNQILINIMGNAVKFTPEGGGRIELLVEEIPPVQDSSHVRIRFTVRYTGIGMPEEFLEHVFEPFARSRVVGEVEWTGLELSITKGLVDLMGGQITVSSSPGQGTCFCVELEFEPGAHGNGSGEKDENGVKPRQDAVLEGTKFPVVEDNVLNSEIMCELLKMCGAQAESQPDGLLGVEAFSSHAPGTYDAILMDIQMPRMNGYEASRANRELDREDAETTPIVAMTANAFTEDIMASKETGMDAHVAKPVDAKVLWGTLVQVLGSKR